ncbi:MULTISPECIES: hypothetical protein [unclassified Pseudomonas]|uniref:hypothetical protein n=1 Tax=unclassified Pseudomonas TaxID=196821 RepID=UPI002449264D|nr:MULTISPECIES: hypothetical protein [unclassified Pseudomonas]MDG9923151.1 hypothetical protein [Pseudomonas sp. GD04045]MDH0034772.1 hypothetical protein [Pseudomonas sp. GD04019]
MDEINPYATPGSALRSDAPAARGKPRGYGWYKWCSLVYGALALLTALIAWVSKALNLAPMSLVVTTIILAPLISYLLIAKRARVLIYLWLPLHLLGALMLLAFGFDKISEASNLRAGIILFMVGSNLLSWLASLYFHWRLGKK